MGFWTTLGGLGAAGGALALGQPALAAGIGLGTLKSAAVDEPKAERQRKLAAATEQYSPWTGLKAQPVEEANPVGNMLQYGTAAASLKQGMANQDAQNGLTKAMTDYYKGGTPGPAMAPMNGYSMGMPGLRQPDWTYLKSLGQNGY